MWFRSRKRIEDKLDAILKLQIGINQEILRKMAQIDDAIAALTAEVANQTTVVLSAEALIHGIPAIVTDAVNKALAAGATQEQIQPILDAVAKIKTNDDELAAAVTANTPAAPSA